MDHLTIMRTGVNQLMALAPSVTCVWTQMLCKPQSIFFRSVRHLDTSDILYLGRPSQIVWTASLIRCCQTSSSNQISNGSHWMMNQWIMIQDSSSHVLSLDSMASDQAVLWGHRISTNTHFFSLPLSSFPCPEPNYTRCMALLLVSSYLEREAGEKKVLI